MNPHTSLSSSLRGLASILVGTALAAPIIESSLLGQTVTLCKPITLVWDYNRTNIDGFDIFRRSLSDTYTSTYTCDKNQRTMTLPVKPGLTCFYAADAFRGEKHSVYSNEISYTPQIDPKFSGGLLFTNQGLYYELRGEASSAANIPSSFLMNTNQDVGHNWEPAKWIAVSSQIRTNAFESNGQVSYSIFVKAPTPLPVEAFFVQSDFIQPKKNSLAKPFNLQIISFN